MSRTAAVRRNLTGLICESLKDGHMTVCSFDDSWRLVVDVQNAECGKGTEIYFMMSYCDVAGDA